MSIHPAHGGEPTGNDAFYVFIVENIDATVAELSSRGVTFEGKISEEGFGRVIEFRDPDGHQLYLWQIPREGEPEYERVKGLARHYARVRAALGR